MSPDHVRVMEPFFGFWHPGAWLGLLVCVAVVVLLAWGLASLMRRTDGRSAGAGRSGMDEADAILRARLARGEINAEEYAETRRILGLP